MWKLGNLLRKRCKQAPRSRRALLRFSFFFFVLFSRRCFRCERKYLEDDKDNKLLWARKYARIVVLGHYLFLEAYNCSLLGADNILGQLSVHISSPKVVYCLYISYIGTFKQPGYHFRVLCLKQGNYTISHFRVLNRVFPANLLLFSPFDHIIFADFVHLR